MTEEGIVPKLELLCAEPNAEGCPKPLLWKAELL